VIYFSPMASQRWRGIRVVERPVLCSFCGMTIPVRDFKIWPSHWRGVEHGEVECVACRKEGERVRLFRLRAAEAMPLPSPLKSDCVVSPPKPVKEIRVTPSKTAGEFFQQVFHIINTGHVGQNDSPKE